MEKEEDQVKLQKILSCLVVSHPFFTSQSFNLKKIIISGRSRARRRVFLVSLSGVPKVRLSDLFGFNFKTIINSDKLACSHPSDIYWHCRRVKLS